MLGLATVALRAFSGVLGIRQRPHPLVLQQIALRLQLGDALIVRRIFKGLGRIDVDQLFFVCRFLCLCVAHTLPRSEISRPTSWAV